MTRRGDLEPTDIWRIVACPACKGLGHRLVIDGNAMRALRNRLGISLRDLGGRVGLSAAFLSDVELGRRTPSQKTGKQLSRTLVGAARRVLPR